MSYKTRVLLPPGADEALTSAHRAISATSTAVFIGTVSLDRVERDNEGQNLNATFQKVETGGTEGKCPRSLIVLTPVVCLYLLIAGATVV